MSWPFSLKLRSRRTSLNSDLIRLLILSEYGKFVKSIFTGISFRLEIIPSFTISSIAASHSDCIEISLYRRMRSRSDRSRPSVSSTDEKNPPPATSIAPSSGVGSVKVFSRGPTSLDALCIEKPNSSAIMSPTLYLVGSI